MSLHKIIPNLKDILQRKRWKCFLFKLWKVVVVKTWPSINHLVRILCWTQSVGLNCFLCIFSVISASQSDGNFVGMSGQGGTVLCVIKRAISQTTCMNVHIPVPLPLPRCFQWTTKGPRRGQSFICNFLVVASLQKWRRRLHEGLCPLCWLWGAGECSYPSLISPVVLALGFILEVTDPYKATLCWSGIW